MLPKDLIRFWNKVDKTDTCWNWTAAKSSQGYGRFRLNGKLESPHVLSYRLHNGDYDSSKDVCHSCDNPSCVNPDHLFLGSRSDNMKDCVRKGRFAINKPTLGRTNELSPATKFSDKDVALIRELYSRGLRQVDIAEIVGCSQSQVSVIVRGESRPLT